MSPTATTTIRLKSALQLTSVVRFSGNRKHYDLLKSIELAEFFNQSPRHIPSARAVRAKPPLGGTVFRRPTALEISTEPTWSPVKATILPYSPAATSSIATAPNIEQR